MSKKSRRKRPGKHTVHTKHKRYDVPNYPRGQGPLVTRHGVTKTQHAWDVDDGMIASPVYDRPTDEWRGDHNRSDVRDVDYHPPNATEVKRYTLWLERTRKIGMRDPENPGKTLPPSHPLTKLRIERIKTDLDYAQRKISLSEYQTRITRNERREKEAKLKLSRKSDKSKRDKTVELKEIKNPSKFQKGMDRPVAAWTDGKYNYVMMTSAVWGTDTFWWRIYDKKGNLVERSDKTIKGSAETFDSLGDAVKKYSTPEIVAEFKKPLKLKRENQALQKNLKEQHEKSEIVEKFQKRFDYGHPLGEGQVKPNLGAITDSDGSVGLIYDKTGGMMRQFEGGPKGSSFKVNPTDRSKLKDKNMVLVGGTMFRSGMIYDSLMILDTKKPIKFDLSKKTKTKDRLLSMTDHEGITIVVAPYQKEASEPEYIVNSPQLYSLFGGKAWGKGDYLNLLKSEEKRSKKLVNARAKEALKEAKRKDYYKTDKQRTSYVNSQLGHSVIMTYYLSVQEKVAEMEGRSIDHESHWRPYQQNKGLWEEGKILV